MLSLLLFYALWEAEGHGFETLVHVMCREAKPILIEQIYPIQDATKRVQGVGNIKRVFLIEHEEDIDNAVSLGTREQDQGVFIALRPPVARALECRGIHCRTLRSYGGGKERWEKTQENFATADEMVAEIDNAIAGAHPTKTVRPACFAYYYLKILLDVISTKILVISAIIATEKPDELVAYRHNSRPTGSFFPFSEEESVFAQLLELDGWNLPVKIISGNLQKNHSSVSGAVTAKYSFTRNISALAKTNNTLFNVAFVLKHFGIREGTRTLLKSCRQRSTRPVMIFGNGYNWDYSIPALFSAGIHPIFHLFGSHSVQDDMARVAEFIEVLRYTWKPDNKIRQRWCIAGIDATPIIWEKILSIVSRSAISSEYEYARSTKILQNRRIRCILVSTQASHRDRAILQAARDQGIRVISWQHGGAGFCYHPFMYQAEFFRSDIHLVFGEGVADSYRKTSELLGLKSVPQFIPVGSSWLDHEQRIRTSKKNTGSGPIIFITEKFQFNLYYNSTTFDSTEICDHLWDVQRAILDFSSTHPLIPFIFKFHPADHQGEPVRSYAANHMIENVRFIVQEQRIQDLIPEAKAIIIDFVSTSVLEAALSDKPVFIYTGMFPMDELPVSLLKKRAFLYDSFPALLEGLERFLEAGPERFAWERDVDYNNTEFIRMFGTHITDGGSAGRAADLVKTVFPEP